MLKQVVRPGKNCLFPCKLGKISLQQGRFPCSVGWFPLSISLFFPSKSQNFPCKELPVLPVFSTPVGSLSMQFCMFVLGLPRAMLLNATHFCRFAMQSLIKVCSNFNAF